MNEEGTETVEAKVSEIAHRFGLTTDEVLCLIAERGRRIPRRKQTEPALDALALLLPQKDQREAFNAALAKWLDDQPDERRRNRIKKLIDGIVSQGSAQDRQNAVLAQWIERQGKRADLDSSTRKRNESFRYTAKVVQFGGTGRLHECRLPKDIADRLDNASVDDADSIFADMAGPRLAREHRSQTDAAMRRDTSVPRGDISKAMVPRDAAQIADTLDRYHVVRFRLIRWAEENLTAVFSGNDEYMVLCVEHNLHPETGGQLPRWKGKTERIARLHEYGVSWADPTDVYTSFGRYVHYLRVASHRLGVAKWKTLDDPALRRDIWGIADQDTGEVVAALKRKWHTDRGIVNA